MSFSSICCLSLASNLQYLSAFSYLSLSYNSRILDTFSLSKSFMLSMYSRTVISLQLSIVSHPPLAAGATSFGLPCIFQSRNSRLCLVGNATREKMHSLGSLLGLYVSKTPPVPRRSSPGFSVRWSFHKNTGNLSAYPGLGCQSLFRTSHLQGYCIFCKRHSLA